MNEQVEYSRHQAFLCAWEKIIENPSMDYDGYNLASEYHEMPEKLADFKDNDGYLIWTIELFKEGQGILDVVLNISSQVDKASSNWYSTKRCLNKMLKEYDSLSNSLKNIKRDIMECQKCYLATDFIGKTGYVETFSDLLRQLDSSENKIVTIINRKLSEIGTARLSIIGIALSFFALITSAISIYLASLTLGK